MNRECPRNSEGLPSSAGRAGSRGWRAALVAACVAAAAIPVALATAATKVQVIPPIIDDPRFPEPGRVSVSGDKRGNDISVEFRSKRAAFVIEDAKARVRTPAGEPGPRCDRIARRKARCKVPPDYGVAAFGNRLDDRIRMRRSVPVFADISGGPGADEAGEADQAPLGAGTEKRTLGTIGPLANR